jgi:sortase A
VADAPADRDPADRDLAPSWDADDAVSSRGASEMAPTDTAAERWIANRLAADRGAADGPGPDRDGSRRPDRADRGRPADRRAPGSVEEPTEVMGPFDVGAWSLQDRGGPAAPARTRGRQRRGDRDESPDDRVPAGLWASAGAGGAGPGGAGPGGAGPGGAGHEPPGGRGHGDNRDPHRPTSGDRIRTVIRGVGQTLLTLGLVMLLLAAYEVWFTDVVNHRTQKHLTTELQKQWDEGDDPTVEAPAKPGQKVRDIPLGDGFALIYIPDFGTDYVYTVVEGTGLDELNEGPGHYVDTPLPGAVGNVSIAGHRVGKGSPFLNLDKLHAGSAIVIRTKSYWYTYRVLGDKATGNPDAVSALGFPGREIVDPSNVGVIAPVPDKPGAKPTQRLLTLTTCHPKFTAKQRMVIHAQLDGAPFPVGEGTPPSMTGS